ncbi:MULTISPECIES: gp16 family protein [Pandoraea]|uniref:gp16 family protein n=1 Tax=Pandoraea TaxID=93217 RepID=UPI001FE970A3|nr:MULTISPECIES: regulatory protein GemA [Pandoraea]
MVLEEKVISGKLLTLIHVARQKLGMDDDTYRAMLFEAAGVRSAKDLTPATAERVLRHMKRSGFVPKESLGRRPKVATIYEPKLRKIEALLADAGRSWSYITKGMVKRICKVDAIEFCQGEELTMLIAALQKDADRRRNELRRR